MTKVDEVKSTIKFQMKKVGLLVTVDDGRFQGPMFIPFTFDPIVFFRPVVGALSGRSCWTCEDDRR